MTEHLPKKQNSNSTRHLMCSKYEAGKSVKQISEELEVNYKTVYNIIKTYKTSNRVEKSTTRGHRRKILQVPHENLIKEMIASDCSTTLNAVKRKLELSLETSASLSTIFRAIENFSFSLKRVNYVPEARNSPVNIERRYSYANEFLSLNEDDCYFLDEAGFNCSMRQSYGRSLIGVPARKTVRSIRSQNFSVCASICKTKILKFEIIRGAYNGNSFQSFVSGFLAYLKEECLMNKTIIMDNCSIHKVKGISSSITNSGHQLLLLPPYSPQLNPIEESFSKWKSIVKSANVRNTDELMAMITNGHGSITMNDCIGFFNDSRRYALKAIRREPL